MGLTMLQFEWPWIFLLLPLPLLVYLFAPRAKQEDGALLIPFYDSINRLAQEQVHKSHHNILLIIFMALIWLLSLTAAARPQWVGAAVSFPASGRDLLLAVDISGSMQTADMILDDQQVDRLTVVKKVVGEFVQRRTTDRLGLILFGTQAYLQAPLTFDRNTVNILLTEARLGFAGERTAIGDAIGLATKRLLKRPENNRVLILLTDGANTAGQIEPLKAAELAKQAQVKIYTVGLGANEWIIPGLFGGTFGSRRVNPSIDLDEKSLIAIAEQTGGKYFRARNVEELEQIYGELDILEPVEQDAESYRPTVALFYYPMAFALLLSLLFAATRLWVTRSRATSVDLLTGKV